MKMKEEKEEKEKKGNDAMNGELDEWRWRIILMN